MRRGRHTLSFPSLRRRPSPHVRQQAERGFEEREIRVAAHSISTCTPDAGKDGDRAEVAGREVDERQAALGRWIFRTARDAHPAREPLDRGVVRPLARARPGGPEARKRHAHHTRVCVLQVVIPQTELRRLVAPQVREERVGAAHEVLEDGPRVRLTQVECKAALVAVEALEEERASVHLERRDGAANVPANGRILDLDDLGAEIGELHGSPGPGPELLERQHPDVLERLHATSFPAAWARRTTPSANLRDASSTMAPPTTPTPCPLSSAMASASRTRTA